MGMMDLTGSSSSSSSSGSDTSIKNMLASIGDQKPLLLAKQLLSQNNSDEWSSAEPTRVAADPLSTYVNQQSSIHEDATNCLGLSSFKPLPQLPQQPVVTPIYRKRHLAADLQVASIFAQPSAYLQQVLRHKASAASSCTSTTTTTTDPHRDFKKQRSGLVDDESLCNYESSTTTTTTTTTTTALPRDDLLHRACCQPNVSVDVVQQLLAKDPTAISRRMTQESDTSCCCFYTYPLHMAMRHQANNNPQVLAALIHAAGPLVLSLLDGPDQETSLHVLLQYAPHDTATCLLLLLSQPVLASTTDAHGNVPLHVAYRYGANSETIYYLTLVHGDARHVKNHLNQTPSELRHVVANAAAVPTAAAEAP